MLCKSQRRGFEQFVHEQYLFLAKMTVDFTPLKLYVVKVTGEVIWKHLSPSAGAEARPGQRSGADDPMKRRALP